MWQIRKIEDIEARHEARRRRDRRIVRIIFFAIPWTAVLVWFLNHHQYAPKDFQHLVLLLVFSPVIFLVLIFGAPRVARFRRKPTVGMFCRKCEKMWYDEKQLVCSCGERLFRIDDLKWVKDESSEQAGDNDTEKDFSR